MRFFVKKRELCSLVLVLLTASAQAANSSQSFSYQGRLLNAAGTAPLLDNNVTLTFGIYDPTGACLLYEETQSAIDTASTQGLFAVQIGSATGAANRTAADPQLEMSKVFGNAGSIRSAGSANCAGGYVAAAGDERRLRITVSPSSGSPTTLTPDQKLGSTPQAWVADTLQGLDPTRFIQITGNASSYAISKTDLDLLLGPSGIQDASARHHHDSLYAKLSGASTMTLASGAFLGLGSRATDPTGLTAADAGKTWFDSASGAIKFFDGSAIRTLGLSDAGNLSLPAGEIFVGNGAGSAQAVSVSGDISLASSGAATVNSVGGVSAANVASGANSANAATETNTANKLVKRDASGNFSAGTITATLTGNVTGNVSGSAASFTGSLSGDVSGTQAATSVDKIKGRTLSAGVPSNGQVLAWNNGLSQWEPQTVSASGGMTWQVITADTTASANNGYITDSAAQLTITLPASCAVGDKVSVTGLGNGGWALKPNTGQTLSYLDGTTSPSTYSLVSANIADSVTYLCVVANTKWAPIAATTASMISTSATAAFTSAVCTASGGTWGTSQVASGACDWLFTSPGLTSWTVPAGVTSVSVVCVGGGGGGGAGTRGFGGGGGGLGYKNNISVTPGSSIPIMIGAAGVAVAQTNPGGNGGDSYFSSAATLKGGGGAGGIGGTDIGDNGGAGGGYVGDGGGNGGVGGGANSSNNLAGGGGGAGGYAGTGGRGGSYSGTAASSGSGGGGGGGSYRSTGGSNGGGGGGVGLYGLGSNGNPGSGDSSNPGTGGSGGADGISGTGGAGTGIGGAYGGGGGGGNQASSSAGGQGACRILWPGSQRTFPSNQVAAP